MDTRNKTAKESLRTAFLTTEFVTEPDSFDGGLANYLYRVCLALASMGHHPIVIVSSDRDEFFKKDGIDVYRVEIKQTKIYKIADVLSRFKLQHTLDRLLISYHLNKKVKEIHRVQKIDIIQYPSYEAAGLLLTKKIPSVMRISGIQKLADEANGLFYKTLREKQRQKLEQWSYKRAEHIFGPSVFIANIVKEKLKKEVAIIESPFLLPPGNIYNYKTFEEIKAKTNNNDYLLAFGRLALLKGTIDIADIIEELLEENQNLYLVFIGYDLGYDGKFCFDYIIKKAGKYIERVLILNKVEHEKLYPVIENSYAVLLPSRIENFSNACIEAMALGKLVIATKGVSFEQLINDRENGYLCNNSDPADLLKTIREVLKLSKEQKEQIGSSAKETIKRLNPEITVKKLISYYKSIING